MKERCRKDEGTDGNQHRRRYDQAHICLSRFGQRREKLFDLRQIGQRPNVKSQIHDLQQDEECLHHGVRGLGKLLRGGQNPCVELSLRLRRLARFLSGSCRWFAYRRYRGRRGFVEGDAFDGSHEAIAAPGQCLNESGIGCGIAEGFADAIDGRVDAVLVVDKGSVRPEQTGNLLTVISWPGRSMSSRSIWKGCAFSLMRMPWRRSSPVAASASKAPKR